MAQFRMGTECLKWYFPLRDKNNKYVHTQNVSHLSFSSEATHKETASPGHSDQSLITDRKGTGERGGSRRGHCLGGETEWGGPERGSRRGTGTHQATSRSGRPNLCPSQPLREVPSSTVRTRRERPGTASGLPREPATRPEPPARDPGRGAFHTAACAARQTVRAANPPTKETEWRARAGGKPGRVREVAGEAGRHEAGRRGGGGERAAGRARQAGREHGRRLRRADQGCGPAKAAGAPRRAQEAAARPRPGSHSSRLPFPLPPAPRGPPRTVDTPALPAVPAGLRGQPGPRSRRRAEM